MYLYHYFSEEENSMKRLVNFKWTKPVILAILLTMIIACVLVGCDSLQSKHEHTWADANCTTPKTCTSCDATEGVLLFS